MRNKEFRFDTSDKADWFCDVQKKYNKRLSESVFFQVYIAGQKMDTTPLLQKQYLSFLSPFVPSTCPYIIQLFLYKIHEVRSITGKLRHLFKQDSKLRTGTKQSSRCRGCPQAWHQGAQALISSRCRHGCFCSLWSYWWRPSSKAQGGTTRQRHCDHRPTSPLKWQHVNN